MQRQYHELQNTRMPRACKKTKQYYQQNVRRTRAAVQHELLQQQQQQNAMYNTTIPVQCHYSAYTIPDQRNLHVDNGLQPTVQQLPRAATAYASSPQPQQPMGPRYHTRNADHNIIMNNNALNMEPYWHAGIPTHQPILTPLQRATSPKPILIPTREATVQTETPITEEEIKFLEMLRTRKLDVSKIYSIIKKSDYVVVFEEVEDESVEQKNMAEATASNNVVACAMQQRNDMMTLAYAAELQRRLASIIPTANLLPAIEYRPQNEPNASGSRNNTEQESRNKIERSLRSSEFETNGIHEVIANNSCSAVEPTVKEITNENIQPSSIPRDMSHGEQQVPSLGFPIPTVTDHFRHNNQMRYQEPNPHEYGLPNYIYDPNNNNNNVDLFDAFVTRIYGNQSQQPQVWREDPHMYQNRPPWL